ncbi:hypothetical protein OPS25_12260 [Alteromonas ponticola]|uniref:Uncharacterized protein n=1 Tax=Alteromonas aquimaris TaxID=2998417 RepID=A0ABT3P920_9ALTE|nr:hypothetical protein [Alteromonas aquimaris]MCW8109273.1 hypothetical protein [Alteromonas aquimaris]
MKHQNQHLISLSSTDAANVAGGSLAKLPDLSQVTPPVTPIKPPSYFTLAIGEGGGHLPDLY